MNWDAVGAIGEVIGAIAVLVTLVYLAIQVRQSNTLIEENTKMAKLAAMESSMDFSNRSRELVIGSAEIADIIFRGRQSFITLDAGEQVRFGMYLRNLFSTANVGYARHLTLLHDPSDNEAAKRAIEIGLRQNGVREWYEQSEFDWYPEFRVLVQSIIDKIDDETSV